MTITTNANSTPRRHCEAKEKIPGERKISFAEAISSLVETMEILLCAKYRFLRMVNYLKCRFVENTNLGED